MKILKKSACNPIYVYLQRTKTRKRVKIKTEKNVRNLINVKNNSIFTSKCMPETHSHIDIHIHTHTRTERESFSLIFF
jgi:hypothetical protein